MSDTEFFQTEFTARTTVRLDCYDTVFPVVSCDFDKRTVSVEIDGRLVAVPSENVTVVEGGAQ